MKNDPTDPPNAPHDDAGALDELVRATRSRGPSPEALRRMSKQLIAAGALQAPSPSEAPAAGARQASRVAGNVGSFKAGAVVLAVTAGARFAWRATTVSTGAPVIEPRGPSAAELAVPTTASREATEPRSALPETPSTEAAVATVSIDALPSAAAPRAASSADTPARGASPASGESVAAPELLIVRQAQDALASNPERALALADEHAHLFPNGELTQEREVVAASALAKLGRRDEALVRARALVRRFPRTPYVAHLEKALGQPLTVAAPPGEAPSADSPSLP